MRRFFRIILGALFCVSAVSKLFTMESFDLYIFSFGLLPFDWCSVAARLAVIAELLLGLGLVSGLWRKCVNWCTVAVLTAFSAFLIWRLAVGDSRSCHCFGEIVDMSPGQSLLKNAGLAVLLALAWKAPGWNWSRSSRLRLGLTLCLAAAVCITVFAVKPASFWYRMKGGDSHLSESLWAPHAARCGMDSGRQAVLFLSPLCEHCIHTMEKLDGIALRHDIDSSRVHLVFMIMAARPEENIRLVERFFDMASSDGSAFDTVELPAVDFLAVTDGVMPLICLFEDGELVGEYGYNSLDEKALVSFLSNDPDDEGGEQEQE